MTLFVGGRLSATPIKIICKAPLSAIRAAMSDRPYGKLPSTGWGSVEDATEDVGRPGPGRPVMAKPFVAPADDVRGYPERLLARFYYDELDKRAVNRFRDADDAALHYFRATDVSISAITHEPGSYLVFVGLGRASSGFGAHFVPQLRSLLYDLDDSSTVLQDTSPTDFGDNDFFKWLLFRTINAPVVGDMKLDFIRQIDGQDGSARGTAISGGADIDRPELLALVSASYTAFGPVKVKLNHEGLELIVDVEIRFDGGFSIKTADSVYAEENQLTKAQKSLRLIQDVGYKVIPELFSAHASDKPWPTTHRPKFISDARSSLVKALAPAVGGQPCAACGQVV